jgi:hypothetical protein
MCSTSGLSVCQGMWLQHCCRRQHTAWNEHCWMEGPANGELLFGAALTIVGCRQANNGAALGLERALLDGGPCKW